MTEMPGFGTMNLADRGGRHEYEYPPASQTPPSPGCSPSQTVGPFFAYGLTPHLYGYPWSDVFGGDMLSPSVEGLRIVLEGQVFDGNGVSVHDALVEIIQADAQGRYVRAPRADGFTGFGRCGTGPGGAEAAGGDTRFVFRTIMPGATQKGAAPFVTVILSMRGLLNHLITRIYFPGDALRTDPVLLQIPEERRRTLLARQAGDNHFHFDIHMQGPQETVFFDL